MDEIAGTTNVYLRIGSTCSSARRERDVGDPLPLGERLDRESDVGEGRAEDGGDLLRLELVEVQHALVGSGLVVEGDQLDLAAVDAAGGVDLFHGEIHGLLRLAAERSVVAGQRLDEADLDRGTAARSAGVAARGGEPGGENDGGQKRDEFATHWDLPGWACPEVRRTLHDSQCFAQHRRDGGGAPPRRRYAGRMTGAAV
nr:hypothetical protein [Actinomadura madurae]